MIRIFRTKTFSRWMRKNNLSDDELRQAVTEMIAGLIDADLGDGVFKKRLATQGQGKRGGVRTLVATNLGGRWFFMFAFAKNERANISKVELRALQELASDFLAFDPGSATGTAKRCLKGNCIW
ncbi:type II toxin-antitoxin system RelE/ParE family toxin [Marinobacter sp. AC-23]|uniref:type II toxin-antitoxin system RelE/ParE family toxin n=1 Tax=Marinobacter sp. AC-23 TaxID=1879031 RepID=UPI0009F5EDB3|nr:type II toxin-antitoxin system RelE/ParE family toxin [Marinobacter sp. AC-23]